MNIDDLNKLSYWDLVELLNQWRANGKTFNCKDCKNCTTLKNKDQNT